MASAHAESGVTPAAYASARPEDRTLDLAQVAWIAALPCALLTTLAVALIGPPLGHAFLGPGAESFWPGVNLRPEPAEHGRYLVSLAGPLLLVAALLASTRSGRSADRALTARLTLGAQLVAVGFVALCFAAQNEVILSAARPGAWEPSRYFTLPTLLVALATPALVLAAMRRDEISAHIARAVRETPARRIACLAAAALFVAIWLTTAVNADSSIGNTAAGVGGHILWSMDETFAILDGRTPLVSFHAQYGQLWPYLVAIVMSLLGTTIFVYTLTMATISGFVLLAVYATLRRVVRSSVLALALFLPIVATGFFMKLGPLDNRYGPANLFSLWPVRYGIPYVLAWLLARHVDRAGPRRLWAIFLVAGIGLLNNPEFGAPAVAATLVALAVVNPPRSRRAAARLLGEAAGGLLIALALVTLLTLVRSGSLPDYGLLPEFSRLYGVGGWEMLPMPLIGIYLVVYLTFAAAIGTAAVRALRREQDAVLTALLMWIGVFGLIAGGYFAGRSHPQVLMDLFSPWAFALVLLLVAALRGLAARGWRRPSPAELALLFGFGLLVCSLAQTPLPWQQVARIENRTPTPVFEQLEAKRFIGATTHPGEKIAILIPLGHRIAYDLHLTNVAPYSSLEAMPTRQQLARTIAQTRREHATKVYVSTRFTTQEEFGALEAAGFAEHGHTATRDAQVIELVDRRAAG